MTTGHGSGGVALMVTGNFGEPERVIKLARPMTIAEVIAKHKLEFRLPTIAVMGDEPVMRGEWNVRIVRGTDAVAFVAIPGGGGGDGGGGGAKQIIGLVAAIALSIAAPMIGGWAAGALGFAAGTTGFTIASTIVSGLVLLGGSLLLNTLFAPNAKSSGSDQGDRVYLARAASNQATPFEPVPVLYGKLRFAPRFASRPYAEFRGNDQFLYQLFAVTLGKADITKIEIGETEAWNSTSGYSPSFSDLEFEVIQPGEDVTLFPANVVTSSEVSSQTVPNPPDELGPFVVNAAGTKINRIAVDFILPGGLFEYDNNGKIKSHSVSLRAQYREIDESGDPVGSWTNIFSQTISRATRTPQRISKSAPVPEGRYEVKLFATSSFSTSDRVASTVQWAGLRGYLTGFVTPPNCTLLAMAIRANEQLSQVSASQIRVTAERYLEVWDALEEDWVEQKTRSIAWAAADIIRNTDYSIGVPDTQYDVAELLRLDSVWAGRGDTFNAIFDRSWLVYDALRACLRAGRAQPVRIGGKIGFTRLEPKQIKRAAFTLRNVVRGSFSHELILFDEEKPDHVVGQYLDETVWAEREVVASLSSIGSDAPAKIEYFGITNHDQAWREAVTDAAVNTYQREIVGFTAEWEGKLLVRGDPILVQHPFLEGIANAGVIERDADVLTVDVDLQADAEDDSYVILRDKQGKEWGPCLVSEIDGRTIKLDAADRAVVENSMGALSVVFSDSAEPIANLLLCAGEMRPFNGLVVGARPNGPDRIDVVAVIDAPEVYLADGEEVMPSPWTPPTLPPAVPLRPVILGLFASLRAAGAGMELDAVWQPSTGATGYVAEVSYDGEESWVEVYNGPANRFTVPVLPQVLALRVAAIGNLQGPWVIRTFVEGEVPDIRIPNNWIDVDIDSIGQAFSNHLAHMSMNMREMWEEQQALALLAGEQDLANAAQFDEVRRSFGTSVANLSATFDETITTAIIPLNGQMTAVADAVTELNAADGDDVSTARFRMTAQTGGDGGVAIGMQGRTGAEGAWRDAGAFLSVPNDENEPSRFMVLADQFVVSDSVNVEAPFVFEDGVAKMVTARIGTIVAGRMLSDDDEFDVNLTDKYISIRLAD